MPERFVPLASLPLASAPGRLAEFGFDGAWMADDLDQLALQASQRALNDAQLAPDQIDVLLYAAALPQAHQRRSAAPTGSVLDSFCYTASWLQEELGLNRATVSGIAQQGCAGMFSALRMARALLAAEPGLQRILCVGVDGLPPGAGREILYNVISDAACAVVVAREGTRARWLGFHQISSGYYWDVPAKQAEIIAAYFPTGKRVIHGLLQQVGLRPDEIDLVIPTGVNASSWPILVRLCGIAEDRLYQPLRRFGHTIAADSFLYLEEAARMKRLAPGLRVLLFAFGFGASWSALLLEIQPEEAA